MRITDVSAQQIVDEIGDLVHQNINLMDENGYIIASNDRSRIGDFHEGAYQIIQQQLPELYIDSDLEQRLSRVRQGINLPIRVDGKVEGVVGITGSYEAVIQYGQIVQRMAAILVKERIRLDEERLDLRVRSRFLEEWVFSSHLSNQHSLYERGLALGIDVRLPRRCMVVCVRDLARYTKTLEGQQFLEQVEAEVNAFLVHYPGTIVLRNAARQILLLNRRPTAQLAALAQELREHLRTTVGADLLVGIDDDVHDLHTAYLQASRALQIAPQYKSQVVSYRDLNIELIFDQVSPQDKLQYLRKLFPDRDSQQLREDFALLDAYFQAEGSISKAAASLYIHKNTLQYRLRQLAEMTGFDVRKPSNAPILYVALQFFRDLDSGSELSI